ncbi:uncharacterized protein [Argopecten irradians]|uniref:uncharacterized protein n=1 Tax=Argopecten irradians TaxID=31199 RepID=UPI003711568F
MLCMFIDVAVFASPVAPVGNKKPTYYTYSDFFTGETRKCGFVECPENSHVVPCKSNGEMDTCLACPAGTHLLDPTNSYMEIYECHKITDCKIFEHTVVSKDYHRCKDDLQVLCQCDTEAGFCGDPCNCKEKICELGETLHSNCTCEKIKTTSIPTTTETAKMALSTTSPSTLTPERYFRKITLIPKTTEYEATETAMLTTSPTTLLTDNTCNELTVVIVIVSIVLLVIAIISTALLVIFCLDEEKQKNIRSWIQSHIRSLSGYFQPPEQSSAS